MFRIPLVRPVTELKFAPPRKQGHRKVETSPRMGPVDHEESGDEEVPFHRGADCVRAQAGRAVHGG